MSDTRASSPAPTVPPDQAVPPAAPPDPPEGRPNPRPTATGAGVRVIGFAPTTPENQALYEAGKEMLIDSIKTGRDFASFMITLSVGGIGVYTGLIKLVLPVNATLTLLEGVFAVIPALVYLGAAFAFIWAYAPQTDRLNVNVPAEIEKNRVATIKARTKYTRIGLGLFAFATLLGIAATFALLAGVLTPVAPAFV